MTSKEKAEELVNAIENKTHSLVKDEEAKICALICVDEILKSNPTKIDCNSSELNYKYWVEVKKEINKL
jgi:hypothetical protein